MRMVCRYRWMRRLVAECQLAGRGQHGRRWRAAPGHALTFSLSLPVDGGRLPEPNWLTLQAGLALREALPAAVVDRVAIKWPNDLMVEGRKLAGILAQSRVQGTRGRLVLGVGLNVSAAPVLAGRQATCLAALGDRTVREDLLVRLVAALDGLLRAPEQPETIRERWRAGIDALWGRAVSSAGGLSGIGRGLAQNGGYRVARPDGTEDIVPPGDSIVKW